MFVQKNFGFKGVMAFTWMHIIWLTIWVSLVAVIHEKTALVWLAIPWLPLSVIGTAVAFYIGFKNNQAYDRLWEARKIWGAIVNSSRAWGSAIKSYVSNQFANQQYAEKDLNAIKKQLIYRHIGWLYALRSQLLIPASWEHINQHRSIARLAKRRREKLGTGLWEDEFTETALQEFLTKNYGQLINYKNTATQIIDLQSQELAELRTKGIIEDFRHMELQKILNDFYIHQGKCERIKKFPLPRQYGSMSVIFVGIFIFLLPFGMIAEFEKLGDWGTWLAIPFTVLIAWVYLVMELVGDYSENPFEGMGNDIPMLALCRTIEIDLKEMLGETDIPPGIEPKNGILM